MLQQNKTVIYFSTYHCLFFPYMQADKVVADSEDRMVIFVISLCFIFKCVSVCAFTLAETIAQKQTMIDFTHINGIKIKCG